PLVGEGQGEVSEKLLTDTDRAKLRNQALEWLRAELDTWSKLLETANDQQRQFIAQTLHHWRVTDTDLASIRDDAELANLPEDEQDAFRELWADVDALLARANANRCR